MIMSWCSDFLPLDICTLHTIDTLPQPLNVIGTSVAATVVCCAAVVALVCYEMSA